MRFAVQGLGSIEDFMRSSPDMGEVAQKAAMLQGKERMLNTALEGQTGVAGIQGNVAAKTGELIGDAEAAAGRDQMWGSIFQTMGQVGGAAIGKFGKPPAGVPRTSPGVGIPGSVDPGSGKAYYGPAW